MASDFTTAFFPGHVQVAPIALVFEGSESTKPGEVYNPPDFMIQNTFCEFFAVLRFFSFLSFP